MVMVQLLVLLVAAWVLVKATELVINNMDALSSETKLAKFGLAAVLVAASTSFPELFVGITSAIEGVPSLSLGNVIGSNIANSSLVIGLAAVVSGSVAIRGDYMRRDLIYAFLVGAIPFILLSDGRLNRFEGLGLIIGYFLYSHHVLRKRQAKTLEEDTRKVKGRFWRSLAWMRSEKAGKILGLLVFGMGVILISAELIVRVGGSLATRLDIPVLLVGLFVVAVGTSLPELSLWIREAMRREGAFVFGNLTGSIMTNSLLVVGVTALIRPIQVVAVESYLIATVAYVVLFLTFWMMTSSKRRLQRWEGGVLILLYIVFIGAEFVKENGYGEWFVKMVHGLWRWVELLV